MCRWQLQLLTHSPLRVAQQWKRQRQYLDDQFLYKWRLSRNAKQPDVSRFELLIQPRKANERLESRDGGLVSLPGARHRLVLRKDEGRENQERVG